MLWRIRSLIFNTLFYSLSFLLLTSCLPMAFLPRSWQRRVPPVWLWIGYTLEKYVLGLDYEVIGAENLPAAPYLVAMKHESAWETMKLYRLFGNPAIVLKKELMDAPILGTYGKAMDMVPVDRSKGREATKYMVQAARQILTDKRPLVIFPQGTRVKPGVKKPYKAGISKLYEDLNIPLVPIALNSGVFWGRNKFWKHPGLITIHIFPAIQPGQDPEQVMQQMQDLVETKSAELAAAAVKKYKLQKEFPQLARKKD